MKSLFSKISIAAPFVSLLLAHVLAKDAVLSKVAKAADRVIIASIHLTRASHTSTVLPNGDGLVTGRFGRARGHQKLPIPAQTVDDETIRSRAPQ